MNAETVDEMLQKLDSRDGYLRALSRKQSNERWLTSIEDGYKWLIPAEGRQDTIGSQKTRTLLCNYDALEIAEGDDVPEAVRKMADGLRAFTDGGSEWCWDHEDCPRDNCDGELQQQDRFNVMCLKCETVFTHQKDDDEHRLIHDCEFVARKPRAMTDGGVERRDPTEDPRACSVCGVYIGFGGDEYCDGCAREIGAKPPLVRCMGCGQRAPQEQMESVDISSEDEYYPTIRYLCPGCSGGESA